MKTKIKLRHLLVIGLTAGACILWYKTTLPGSWPEMVGEENEIPAFERDSNNQDLVWVTHRPSVKSNFHYNYPNNSERRRVLAMRVENFTSCATKVKLAGPFNDYIPESRNPCWRDKGVLRCVPAFYLPGFSKCGTTDLFSKIVKHPQIVTKDKEIHWLDYFRYKQGLDSIESYSTSFDKASGAIAKDIHEKGYSKLITGEATPNYVWNSLYWQCYEGNNNGHQPRFTNADIIHHNYPKTKIIVTLREPASRLYSSFLFTLPLKKDMKNHFGVANPDTFHQGVVKAVGLYKKCFQEWSVRHCAYNGTLYEQVKMNFVEGLYSVFLRDWLRVFPREQIHLVIFEDYVQDTNGSAVEKVFDFLELDPLNKTMIMKIMKKPVKNKGQHYGVGPMKNETRQLLRDFFAPFVKELHTLVGDKETRDKLDLWGYFV